MRSSFFFVFCHLYYLVNIVSIDHIRPNCSFSFCFKLLQFFSFDVIFNGYGEEIMSRFLSDFKDYRVVFSAESFCWPDPELSEAYPLVQFGKR